MVFIISIILTLVILCTCLIVQRRRLGSWDSQVVVNENLKFFHEVI